MSNIGTNEEMNWNEMDSTDSLIKEGKQLFIESSLSPEDMRMNKILFGGDIVYKGYPNADKKGNLLSFDDMTAMSSQCEDKDAAWKFIRTLFTEEYEGGKYLDDWGFPVREDVYQAFVDRKTCTEEYTDKYGNNIKPLDGEYGYGEAVVDNKPYSQEEMDNYRTLVDSANGVRSYDMKIRDIVEEEALSYFSGDKSVDEVASIIQNRVSTYVNENK
jgi:ABC-type glycerol-3-phosphate transport system substrate-binding protein